MERENKKGEKMRKLFWAPRVGERGEARGGLVVGAASNFMIVKMLHSPTTKRGEGGTTTKKKTKQPKTCFSRGERKGGK